MASSATSPRDAVESSCSPERPASARRASSPSSRRRAADGVTWLEGACHSYGGLPGWPFVEILLGWLGGEIGEPEIAIRTKARAGLGALFGAEARVAAPSAWPGFCESVSTLRPRRRRRRTQRLVRWLERLSATKPVIVAIEDTQWADAPTRRLAEADSRADRPRAHRARPDRGADSGIRGRRAPISCARRLRAQDHGDRARPTRRRRGRAGARRHRRRRDRRGDSNRTHPRGGRESALPGGARAGLSRGSARAAGTHVDGHDRLARAASSLAREPPRRPDRSPVRRAAQARPDRGGDRADVPGRGSRAQSAANASGEALKSLLRAEIVREVSRYPELRVHLHPRPPPRGRALDAHSRRGSGRCTRRSHRRSRRSTPGHWTSTRAARPLPRAGGEPAEGARVRRAGSRRLRASARATSSPRSRAGRGRSGRSSGRSISTAAHWGRSKSGMAGTSFAICPSALFRTRACWSASKIRSAWSRSRVTEPLAVARVVLRASAAEDRPFSDGSGSAVPAEERDVELAAREDLAEERRAGCEARHHLDPDTSELRLDELEHRGR